MKSVSGRLISGSERWTEQLDIPVRLLWWEWRYDLLRRLQFFTSSLFPTTRPFSVRFVAQSYTGCCNVASSLDGARS